MRTAAPDRAHHAINHSSHDVPTKTASGRAIQTLKQLTQPTRRPTADPSAAILIRRKSPKGPSSRATRNDTRYTASADSVNRTATCHVDCNSASIMGNAQFILTRPPLIVLTALASDVIWAASSLMDCDPWMAIFMPLISMSPFFFKTIED